MDIVESTLKDREAKYGDFAELADFAQEMKHLIRTQPNWENMNPRQQEAMEMIAHKMARIMHGEPSYEDSWIDIAGYAVLATR